MATKTNLVHRQLLLLPRAKGGQLLLHITLQPAARNKSIPVGALGLLYVKNKLHERLGQLADQLGVERYSGQRFDVSSDASSYHSVLFSGHLSHLVPAAGLDHRGLYLLHLSFPAGLLPDNDTWYAPESSFWFGRVSQPARFSPALQSAGQDILCVEIPEGRWGPSRDFLSDLDTIVDQLVDAEVLPAPVAPIAAQQTWLPRVYPLYRRGWFSRWQDALQEIAARGAIYPIGRQGLFLHCNMDHCVHIADEAVRHVLSEGSAADWATRCLDFLDLRVRD